MHDRDRKSKSAAYAHSVSKTLSRTSSFPDDPDISTEGVDNFDSKLNLCMSRMKREKKLIFLYIYVVQYVLQASPSMELIDVPRLTKTLDSYGVAIFCMFLINISFAIVY